MVKGVLRKKKRLVAKETKAPFRQFYVILARGVQVLQTNFGVHKNEGSDDVISNTKHFSML